MAARMAPSFVVLDDDVIKIDNISQEKWLQYLRKVKKVDRAKAK